MKNRLLRKSDLKSKLAATSTLDEVAAIAREYEGVTELSLDALENIAGGVSADTGGHTHVWGKEEVKFGGLLRSKYCKCGACAYYFSDSVVGEDVYYDIFAHLKGIMPKMENA